ncbi:dihydrofolate reductase [Dietzia kunjamensis]|uniref:dihydrofolate reductase family protein n=1 Tax=Dietzia kunjamensis TaxID=322509 RepID=UPI000E71143A|nr:dihydrofolate reductase family protein [Dietzia kunjamensis]MBB1013318.1 dihydrofolate reductase [Dietzia kunjamensis]RKE59595.1 dihydrofolate reductase [Dietzia kunjamensis]
MRKLIYYVAVSVDGFIADPGGGFDDFLVEGDHMPWIIEHYPETIPGHLREPLGLTQTPHRVFDTVIMGRAIHQVAVDEGLASGYPHLRQYVVTHRPGDLPAEEGLTASDEDPVTLVRRLKAEDSPLDIWLCGGGMLAGQVVDEIDELRLQVNPVVLGAGIPLVARATSGSGAAGGSLPLALTRRMRRDFESGVSYVEYSRG